MLYQASHDIVRDFQEIIIQINVDAIRKASVCDTLRSCREAATLRERQRRNRRLPQRRREHRENFCVSFGIFFIWKSFSKSIFEYSPVHQLYLYLRSLL
ncbi:hypothetical protein IQ277_14300 [Nostocales cyanobacterium LEGE 12452]|nr:hypothetical protein [Nostocales cyanobacterium LEGE 12452]